MMVDGRVVGTVERCWSERQLALALPKYLAEEAQQKLAAAGWQIILADPAQPEATIQAVRQELQAGA